MAYLMEDGMSIKLTDRERSWLQSMDADLRWFGRRARFRNRCYRLIHPRRVHA